MEFFSFFFFHFFFSFLSSFFLDRLEREFASSSSSSNFKAKSCILEEWDE